MMIPNKKEKNQFLKYLTLMGTAAQMGVTIYLGTYLGKKLDVIYPNEKNYFTILLTLVGVFVALFVIIKQLNRINQK